jgi:hypothetical protein
VAEPRLQRLVDQLLAINPDERLQSVHPLLSVLVEWYGFTAALQPLKLGKPNLALFDETSDDDGQKLTAVLKGDDPVLLKVRRDYAGRSAGSDGPPPPGPLAEADREQPSEARADSDEGGRLGARHYLLALLFVVLGGVAGFLWFSGYFASAPRGAARPDATDRSSDLPSQDAAASTTADAAVAPASGRAGDAQTR